MLEIVHINILKEETRNVKQETANQNLQFKQNKIKTYGKKNNPNLYIVLKNSRPHCTDLIEEEEGNGELNLRM